MGSAKGRGKRALLYEYAFCMMWGVWGMFEKVHEIGLYMLSFGDMS